MATGLLRPDSGSARILGVDVWTDGPHKRTANPLDTGAEAEASGTMYLAMFAVIIAALPAVLAALFFGWWDVLVGPATGLVCWHQLGRLAARRLDATGSATTATLARMPKGRRRLVQVCFLLCWLPLFPQGLVPVIMLVTGTDARVWFLAIQRNPNEGKPGGAERARRCERARLRSAAKEPLQFTARGRNHALKQP